MEFTVPEPSDVLARIADVLAKPNDDERPIKEWRAIYMKELVTNRKKPDTGIFNGFVNNLLERAMPGEAWNKREQKFKKVFVNYDAVTKKNAREVLKADYRWGPEKGTAVIMAAKRIVTANGFTWPDYVCRAEGNYESDFREDDFLKIKNVGLKVRDLALSALSARFVAIDLHVVRVTSRTGLLLHGYGDARITTEVTKSQGYLFFHDLMLKLARRTGWPDGGYSPGEIDRMFWNFGRSVCNANPKCKNCPLADTCLTSVGRSRLSGGVIRISRPETQGNLGTEGLLKKSV